MLPPAPATPLYVQQSYKHVTVYFATFLAFMVLSLNQERHLCHKETLTPSYHMKQGSSLAWLREPQINKNINDIFFLLGGLQSYPDNSPSDNNFRYRKCHKKLDEIKLIF